MAATLGGYVREETAFHRYWGELWLIMYETLIHAEWRIFTIELWQPRHDIHYGLVVALLCCM